MCLYTKQIKPLVAEKDIVCYKQYYPMSFIRPDQDIKDFKYISVYQYYYVKDLGKITTQLQSNSFSGHRCSDINVVDLGFHSYASKEDAIKYKFKNAIIIKCIIPKGTKYYIGYYSDKTICNYCSEALILKKELRHTMFNWEFLKEYTVTCLCDKSIFSKCLKVLQTSINILMKK